MNTTQENMVTVIKAKFGFDDNVSYEGYHSGTSWNGWARPCFEFNEAVKIMDRMYSVNGESNWTFDVDNGSFSALYDPNDIETLDIWPMLVVYCQDDKEYKLVFGIGAGSWIWTKM